MPPIKGQRLYVELGASQARKRLKGVGLGVRKVQSTGRNQAVIIHTATGQHQRELRVLFQDVLSDASTESAEASNVVDRSAVMANAAEFAESPLKPLEPLERLRNIGPISAMWLKEAGIHNREELQRLGPALVFRLIRQRRPACSLNLLWALAGAVADIDWRELPQATRDRLKQEAEAQ
jgi:DNA transformation protein